MPNEYEIEPAVTVDGMPLEGMHYLDPLVEGGAPARSDGKGLWCLDYDPETDTAYGYYLYNHAEPIERE